MLLLRLMLAVLAVSTCVGVTGRAREQARHARPLQVVDTIESRELLELGYPYGASSAVHLSPDKSRFLIPFRTGDLWRNGYWLELFVGRTDSLEAAADLQCVLRLFTAAKRNDATGRLSPLYGGQIFLTWLGSNRHVAFLWNDGESETQVLVADVVTGEVRRLTDHATSIARFGVSHDATALAFFAYPVTSKFGSEERRRSETVVSAESALDFVRGYNDENPWRRLELFVQGSADRIPRKVSGVVFSPDTRMPSHFSPDGKYALIWQFPSRIPDAWNRYDEGEFHARIELIKKEQRRLGTVDAGIIQPHLLDIDAGTLMPLLDAPLNPSLTAELLWSPDSRFVAVGPIFLPFDVEDTSTKGDAIAIVDVKSRRVSRLPLPDADRAFTPTQWADPDRLLVSNGGEKLEFVRHAGLWTQLVRSRDFAGPASIRLELRQDLNHPPELFAIDPNGTRERRILEVNPRMKSRYALAPVRIIEWHDGEDRRWTGRLYYPSSPVPAHRLPLVIQTHGHAPADQFSLRGNESTTVFAAQALAGRGMAVLHVQDRKENQITPEEPEMYMKGYEAAIGELFRQGVVDKDRVGLAGYSRTGWHVEYTLTRSAFPYRAAIIADNIDAGYLQATLFSGDLLSEFSQDVGAEPYGIGLEHWLERSPGFNVERIITPLRMEIDSGGRLFALTAWEVYSRLHNKAHPVELIIVPDIEHGDHPLQIPFQQLASQAGAVDWFDFWLNGYVDPDPAKAQQYRRWEVLLAKRNAIRLKTRPALLDWRATPERSNQESP